MIKGLGDIRKFVESGRTKGFLAFLKEVILYGFMTFITVIVLNPDIIYQNLKERQEREHNARLEKRLEADPIIRSNLKELMVTVDGDRAFVCEFHNGTNNFAGLPFLYVDMKYEVCKQGIYHIDETFTNFNLTRYPFAPYGMEHGWWIGTVKDMEEIDERFSAHMEMNGVNFFAAMLIHGVDAPVGILGVTFAEPVPREDWALIKKEMVKESQKLSILLVP